MMMTTKRMLTMILKLRKKTMLTECKIPSLMRKSREQLLKIKLSKVLRISINRKISSSVSSKVQTNHKREKLMG